MKAFLVVVTLFAVAFSHPLRQKAPLLAADSETAIEGEYIVVFKKTAHDDALKSHMESVHSLMKNLTKSGEEMKVLSEYRIGQDFRGYSARMSDEMVDSVREMSEVDYLERNQEVHALQSCNLQAPLEAGLWGLERTTLRMWNRNNEYSYDPNADGLGIEAYIIDTGVDYDHPDFIDKRVRFGYDAVNGGGNGFDDNGHGTHVAGTVLGNKYGIAKRATGVAVKVLNANGSGSYEQVIAGVNYVAGDGVPRKSVANMSLGGGVSIPLNSAVTAAINQGIAFAVAAGNEASDACSRSPASADGAVTVGATDAGDNIAYFSNWGPCVNIFAPGVDVLSATPGGGSAEFSGTSMASPHVAGVMAKILSENEMDPADLTQLIESTATPGVIKGIPSGTKNLLIFKECI